MKSLFVYCAGGFGKEVIDIARRVVSAHGTWNDLYFIDDCVSVDSIYGVRIFRLEAAVDWLSENSGEVVIASGEPEIRKLLRAKLEASGISMGTLVDNTALFSDSVRIASGVVVAPFCSISSNASLGKNSSVNSMSIVGHDVSVGENSVISSMVNLGGNTKIGSETYIGMGALIKERVTVGDGTIIGMGSVVYNDIPDNVIALGNPARAMRPNTEKKVFNKGVSG